MTMLVSTQKEVKEVRSTIEKICIILDNIYITMNRSMDLKASKVSAQMKMKKMLLENRGKGISVIVCNLRNLS